MSVVYSDCIRQCLACKLHHRALIELKEVRLSQPTEFTRLLSAYRQGSPEAPEQLFTLVYQDLRRLAQQYLKQERPGHTLQATALVHEAWLRLFGEGVVELESRAHFFVIAARQMRRILIDHARTTRSDKRGGGQLMAPLEEAALLPVEQCEELLALDQALTRLEHLYPRVGRIVELRFFAGLTEAETAVVLKISVSALKRDWVFAKVWLVTQIR